MKKKFKSKKPITTTDILTGMDIPMSIMPGTVNIEICSNKEITLIGETTIIKYSDNLIALNTKEFPLSIMGLNLYIKQLGQTSIIIGGEIKSVEFLI